MSILISTKNYLANFMLNNYQILRNVILFVVCHTEPTTGMVPWNYSRGK